MSRFIRIDIQYDDTLVTERNHKRICNQLYRERMQAHKEKIIPRHFDVVPETRPGGAYGYTARTRRWQKKKDREGRGDRPLVYTGLMRTIVTRESVVRATANGASLTAKNHYPMTPQRRNEVEKISNQEIDRMVGRMKIDYVKKAQSPEFARKRRRRITTGTP